MPKYSREELLERIVDTLLTGGLVEASLRPLAKAAGTSDRMLLYYFKDKDTLLSEAFSVLAARILSQLEADFPTGSTAAAGDLLRHLGQATRGEQMAPAMRLWIEITAAASRGIEPHKSVGAAILNGFLHWIEVRLPVDYPGDRPASAAAILAAVDGAAILDILGRPDAATKSLEEVARRFD